MAEREYAAELAQLESTLSGIEKVLELPKLKEEAAKLEVAASAPNLWDDASNAQKVTSKLAHTQNQIKQLESLRARINDLPVLLDLAREEIGRAHV